MFVSPMLLQYAENNLPFDSPNHAAELKFDGFRMVLSKMDQVRLYTRHNNEVTTIFSELLDIELPNNTILDGELILTDEQGKPDFEELQKRFKSKRDKRKVTFVAFDIVMYKGVDVTGLPLFRRKELLEEAFPESKRHTKSRFMTGSPVDVFEVVKGASLEGIVIKDVNSTYKVNKRSWDWQKVINWTYADVYITGYRKKEFGWLTSIIAENGTLRPVGILELGVTPDQKNEFNRVRKKLTYKEDKNYVYMEPFVKVRVKTRNWTKNGMLRSPAMESFVL